MSDFTFAPVRVPTLSEALDLRQSLWLRAVALRPDVPQDLRAWIEDGAAALIVLQNALAEAARRDPALAEVWPEPDPERAEKIDHILGLAAEWSAERDEAAALRGLRLVCDGAGAAVVAQPN
jgi:hypothetical protein